MSMTGLTDNEKRVAELIVQGVTVTDIAKIIGVSRPTIYDWLKHEQLKATIAELTTDIKNNAEKKLNAKVDTYVGELEKIALTGKSEKNKLDALQYILNRIFGTPTTKTADVTEEENKKENPEELKEEFNRFRIRNKAV